MPWREPLIRRGARRRGRSLSALALVLCLTAVMTTTARAGDWIQVSCVNPDGTAAPSEGWSAGSVGNPGAGITTTQCSPGSPMEAELSDLAASSADSGVYLQYQPPSGSTLIGGQLNAVLSADGYGNGPSGSPAAAAYAALDEPGLSNTFFQCVAFFTTCGPSPDYSGAVNLPSDAGGDLYAEAGCTSTVGTPCDANATNNAWALVRILSAHALLVSNVSPQASGFRGSGLQRGVRGTGHVVFTAAESAGPGIYLVAVRVDGRLVWAGSPNANGGECAAVGTDPATGALMFDHQQPCLQTEVVDAPVPTARLSDGRHELAISVADAAGNTSTVLDQTITTSNPEVTPSATGRGAIRATFVISWTWRGRRTRLRTISVRGLPRTGRLAVTCRGRGCPRLPIRSAPLRRAGKLLTALGGATLSEGDRLELTVTAPGHRPERVGLRIRDNRVPLASLLKP